MVQQLPIKMAKKDISKTDNIIAKNPSTEFYLRVTYEDNSLNYYKQTCL